MTKNFVFENPTYVMKVVQKGGIPTQGDVAFIWPEQGPVEDRNWKPKKECGNGLHACRVEQLQSGMGWLTCGEQPRFLVCQVEESEIIDLRDKCKFPRCNVVHFGGWKDALQALRLCGEEDVPEDEDFRTWAGWSSLTDANQAGKNDFEAWLLTQETSIKEMPKIDAKKDSFAFGSLVAPVTYDELLAARASISGGKVLDDAAAKHYAILMERANVAGRLHLWALLQKNPDNLFAVHPYIEKLMVKTVTWESGFDLRRWFSDVLDIKHRHRANVLSRNIDPDDRERLEAEGNDIISLLAQHYAERIVQVEKLIFNG